MVDDQHLAAGVGEITQRAEPVDARNVDGDDQIGVAAHSFGANQQMATRQRLQGFGQLGGRGETHLDRLACVVEHQGERQTSADGVRVGIDVADDADGGGRVQQVGGLARIDARRPRGRASVVLSIAVTGVFSV